MSISPEVAHAVSEHWRRLSQFVSDELDFSLGVSVLALGVAMELIDAEPAVTHDTDAESESAQTRRDAVQKLVEMGPQRLDYHNAVSMWAAFEVFVEDVFVTVAGGIEIDEAHPLSKVRVPLALFEKLTSEERLRLLGSRYETRVTGVDRFDELLDVLHCKPEIEDLNIREHLRELQQVRNVVLHRGGIADHRLANLVRTFAIQAGDELELTHEQLMAYASALNTYGVRVVVKAYEAAGIGETEGPTA